jgi:ABC-2 type transport system permease protein
MTTRTFAIAWKEMIQLRRDRMTLAIMAALPILQLVLFGYAINTDVRHIPTVVLDHDHSARSRDLVHHLTATGVYDVAGEVRSYDDIQRVFRAGKARVAIVVPAKYSTTIERGLSANVQLVVDGSDPQTVASAGETAASVAGLQSGEVTQDRIARAGLGGTNIQAVPISVEPTTWYNPDLRTSTFIVPGLIGVILTMTMVMLTSMAMARERERGTLEQLIVTPVRRSDLVVGKILPYVAIGYVQMTLVLLVGKIVFGVPIIGSLLSLYVLAFVFIASNLALGLFFSTLARTQQQAMQMSFFFFLPNILLSGFAFPWDGMPAPARWLSQALPLTHFLRVVRGIILKGANFTDLTVELVWMGGIMLALMMLAAARSQKKLA